MKKNIGENDIEENLNEEQRKENFDFLKVVKERRNFPCKFSKGIQLKNIINYYDNNWAEGGISDDDEENDGDDDSDKAKGKIIVDSSSSSSERRRRRRKKSSSSSDWFNDIISFIIPSFLN